MFLIAFAFAWVFFIVHTKGYPNYVPFSTSTHALLSARTTRSRDFVLRTLLWKAPLDHHPRAPLPCPGPTFGYYFLSRCFFHTLSCIPVLFPWHYHFQHQTMVPWHYHFQRQTMVPSNFTQLFLRRVSQWQVFRA